MIGESLEDEVKGAGYAGIKGILLDRTTGRKSIICLNCSMGRDD